MIKFGTGGWRAIIGDEFTKANVQLLTLALARKMQDEGKADKGFVIGYDRRFLSEEAAKWAAEVMAGEGIVTAFIHRESPTPLVMYEVQAHGYPYGMAELIGIAISIVLHLKFNNALLSIFVATLSYMVMVQFVF